MVMDDTEKAVFALVEEYNGHWFWLRKRFRLTPATDLNKDFRMAPEDAAELLETFADRFSVDPKEINFGRYFPADNGKAEKPLTIQLLIDSARAGHWIDK